MDAKKILIAYFSRAGENYSNGQTIRLPVGNTAVVAKGIAVRTSGDLFEIRRVDSYPDDYLECVSVSREELTDNTRPALKETIDIAGYDAVILGYPNWCGTMPMPVWTFLESEDFKGKLLLPFCTNGGSGMGNSERDIQKLCPDAQLKKGLPIRESGNAETGAVIDAWLKENGL